MAFIAKLLMNRQFSAVRIHSLFLFCLVSIFFLFDKVAVATTSTIFGKLHSIHLDQIKWYLPRKNEIIVNSKQKINLCVGFLYHLFSVIPIKIRNWAKLFTPKLWKGLQSFSSVFQFINFSLHVKINYRQIPVWTFSLLFEWIVSS